MPRVPAAPSVQPNVRRMALEQDTSINLQPLAEGFMNAANAAQRAADEIGAIRMAEADTEFTNRVNDALFRSEQAYFNRVGKDAVDSLIPMEQEIVGYVDEIAEQMLERGEDKQAFKNQALKRLEAARNRMAQYAHKEKLRWDANTSTARIAAQAETVHLDPGVEQIELALPTVTAEAVKSADSAGMPGDSKRDVIVTARSSVMRAGVEGAVTNGDVPLAVDLFEKYKDQMTADDRMASLRRISAARGAAEDANKQHVNEVRQMIKGYEEALSRGWIPEDKNEIAAMVAMLDDDTTTNQWTNATRFDGEVTEFAQMSLPQQREALSQLRTGQGGGSSMGALMIDQLEGVHDRHVAMAKEDPLRLYLEKTQQPQPDIRTMSGMMTARRMAEQAERETGERTLPVTQAQLTQLQRSFMDANAPRKVSMAGAMVQGFGPDMSLRLFGELDKKLGKGIGVAGALIVEGQNDVAEMVVEGIDRLGRDSSMLPNTILQENLDELLGGAYGGPGARADKAIRHAVAGVYLELQRADGEFQDRTDDINNDVLEDAVDLVTGGVLEYEGRLVVAPRRGVTDSQFEDWADSLSPKDFGLVEGISADQAYNSWRANGFLESVGPGLYRPAFVNADGRLSSFKIRTAGTDPQATIDQLRDLVLFYRPPSALVQPEVTESVSP